MNDNSDNKDIMTGDKEQKVHQVFQNIYEKYDRMNDIISLGQHRIWKNNLVCEVTREEVSGQEATEGMATKGETTGEETTGGKATKASDRRILDLCCGTGDMSLMLAGRNPYATVYGVDFSSKMLEVAKQRLQKKAFGNVLFLEGNAMSLEFEDNFFDNAVISFGLRNVSDYGQVLGEMQRVVKPGGKVYCLESSYPDQPIIRPFFRIYFKFFVPMLGRILTGHPLEYKWLNESTEKFLGKKELAGLFREVGLTEVTYRTYMFGASACHQGRKPI